MDWSFQDQGPQRAIKVIVPNLTLTTYLYPLASDIYVLIFIFITELNIYKCYNYM